MGVNMRYIKLWDGITSKWRYSNSPYHMQLFIHCLIEAWHADAKEFKRGSFRTSQYLLKEQTGISRKKIVGLLKDLSTGDNPEIDVKTKKGHGVGYTEITILNYVKYQSNVSESASNVSLSASNVSESASNVSESASNVSLSASNVSLSASNVSQGYRKEEEDKKRQEQRRETPVTDETFLSRLSKYPKNPSTFDLINFNLLALDDQISFSKFIEGISNIWESHGDKTRTQYVKKIEDIIKMFNNGQLRLDTSDPGVISTILKIDKPIKKQFVPLTVQQVNEIEKADYERQMLTLKMDREKKLAQEQNNI